MAERTLSPKRDIRRYIDEMNRTDGGKRMTDAYQRGLITLEEYITSLFQIEKEMITGNKAE